MEINSNLFSRQLQKQKCSPWRIAASENRGLFLSLLIDGSDQRSHHHPGCRKGRVFGPHRVRKIVTKKKPGDFETRKKIHGVSGFQGSPEKRSTKTSPTWISRKMQHLKQPKPPSMTFGFQRILVCWGVKFFPFSRVLRDFGGHPWDGWTQINTHVLS